MNEKIFSQREVPRESLEKAIPEIQTILLRSYQEQVNQTYIEDQAVNKIKKLCQEIAILLQKSGVSIEPTQSGVIGFFQKQKIALMPSPLPVWVGQFKINHPMYILWKSDVYDMSRIRFSSEYGLPVIRKGASFSEVSKTIVPEVREAVWFTLNGLTVENPKTGESTVLIFPERINQNAKQAWLSVREYKDVVVTNEIGQVYFSELIPNKFHGIRLAEDMHLVAPMNTTVHHVNEAFSDLCSLKFTKWWKSEVLRILQSRDEGYKFSKLVLIENLKQEYPMFRSTDAIYNKIQWMNHEEFTKLNHFLIEGYEQNILPIIPMISSWIKNNNGNSIQKNH